MNSGAFVFGTRSRWRDLSARRIFATKYVSPELDVYGSAQPVRARGSFGMVVNVRLLSRRTERAGCSRAAALVL
jgi:hypothetical protein